MKRKNRFSIYALVAVFCAISSAGVAAENRQEPSFEKIQGRYNNFAWNYSIQFPNGWEVQTAFQGSVVKAIDPMSVNSRGRVTREITVQSTKEPRKKNLDAIVDKLCSFKNCTVESRGETRISGVDAQWIVYSTEVPEMFLGVSIQGQAYTHFMNYAFLKNEKLYIVGFATALDDLLQHKNEFEQTAGSFKFENLQAVPPD